MHEQVCSQCGGKRASTDLVCPLCGFEAVAPAASDPVAAPVQAPAVKGRSWIAWVAGFAVLIAAAALIGPRLGGGQQSARTSSSATAKHPSAREVAAGSTAPDLGSGAWSGDLGDGSLSLSLDVSGDSGSGLAHLFENNRAGTWEVSASENEGVWTIAPTGWVAQPPTWKQAPTLEVSVRPDQGLDGETRSGRPISLDQVADGALDADAVDANWRSALAMDEDTAGAILADRSQAALPVRDGLDYTWVPQVASGCQNLTTLDYPLTDAAILASNARLSQDYDAITVAFEDISVKPPTVCPGTPMYVSLIPKSYDSARGALAWCHRHDESCAARYVVPRGERGTDIRY